MRKLALNVDDLALQSFQTLVSANPLSGTVVGHLDETAYDACATQVYTCAGCEPADEPPADDGDPDAGRRIIVYQTPN